MQHNLTTIKETPKKAFSFIFGGSQKEKVSKYFFARLLTIKIVGFLTLFSFAASANAGIFSVVASFVAQKSEAASVQTVSLNSQTMTLLKAPAVSNTGGKGGGDITIVDGSALAVEIGPSGTPANIEDRAVSHEISVYVVHKGDTLGAIAKMFKVSVNTIIWSNNIERGIVREGQSLVILPVSGLQYTIKTGDTLKSIATKYKADIDEIVAYNDLDSNSKLEVGLEILIPDAEIVIPKAAPKVTGNPFRGGSGPLISGYYVRPADGPKTQGLHGYNGIDIGGPVGGLIYAAAAGQVIIARMGGWNGGYGTYVVIKHPNGTQTLYSHMSRTLVDVGDFVAQGKVIGLIGATGKATGPHLHFEVRGASNPF